jgi:membrane protease YdiL (CAAX protease family)
MPLRIVVGLGLWVVVGVIVSDLLAMVVSGPSPLLQLRTSHLGNITVSAIDLVVGSVSTPIAIYLAGRYVDRRRFQDFGFRIDRRWWIDLGFGLVLGGVLMTGIFLLQLALGWVTITGFLVVGGVPQWTFPYWFLLSVLSYLAGSVIEELLHRGFLLTNFAEGFQIGPVGPTGAVAVGIALTSGFFAFTHATATNATTISTLSIALAGVFLALGYILTGELALPIGVHIAWNFFEGNLYGFPISGTGTTSLIGIRQSGPEMMTGGAFGPEAGLLGVIAIAIGIVVIATWARYYRGTPGIHPKVTMPELRE